MLRYTAKCHKNTLLSSCRTELVFHVYDVQNKTFVDYLLYYDLAGMVDSGNASTTFDVILTGAIPSNCSVQSLQVWEHMGTYGNIWGHMGTYGNTGKTYGDIWEHMGTYGNIWEHMGTQGIWGHLETYGNTGNMGGTYGNTGHMGTYGNIWGHMGTYGDIITYHILQLHSHREYNWNIPQVLTLVNIYSIQLKLLYCPQALRYQHPIFNLIPLLYV